MSASRNTVSFDFFAVHEIRSISVGTTFLLLPVSFEAALKLSRPRIHTLEWVQYSTSGLFFLCGWRCIYLLVRISSSRNVFACNILDATSVLLRLSFDIKVLK